MRSLLSFIVLLRSLLSLIALLSLLSFIDLLSLLSFIVNNQGEINVAIDYFIFSKASFSHLTQYK